jgi:hypothetical protein
MKDITNDMPVGEAHRLVMDEGRWEGGVECPCCEQNVEVFKRPIHATMTKALILIFKATDRDRQFVSFPRLAEAHGLSGGGDNAKLAYWGFIEDEGGKREDGGREGYWRITDKGAAFCRGEIKVPSHVLIYDRKFLGFDTSKEVGIEDCSKKFDLAEMLADAPEKPKQPDPEPAPVAGGQLFATDAVPANGTRGYANQEEW